jgi:hypothetical protein
VISLSTTSLAKNSDIYAAISPTENLNLHEAILFSTATLKGGSISYFSNYESFTNLATVTELYTA